MTRPSIPKGTRDFSTTEMLKREYIFNTVRNVFRLYGYQPIETPAMENLSTLLGKYGEEGDKLLFRILNSGNWLSDVGDLELQSRDHVTLSSKVCEKGLRYDLTVPFARYVVQHREEIVFPFRRYQIQPVWRADRPQKGRYREFFQCDADVIGSDSLLNEYELVKIIDEIFRRLRIPVIVKLNNRKILSGIAEYIGNAARITEITVAIDKLDKIGIDSVNAELREKGLSGEAVAKLQPVISMKGTTAEKLQTLRSLLKGSEAGMKGIEETEILFSYFGNSSFAASIEFDLTLARGLNYYTGAIIEVKSKDVNIGSICGGGRYDNLTGVFGLPGVSGVGVSFGADRIYDVLTQLNLFNDIATAPSEVMVVNFGENELGYSLRILDIFRENGVTAEIYPDNAKVKKQLSYAASKNIPYVAIAGTDEISAGKVTMKNMLSGEQQEVNLDSLPSFVTPVVRKEPGKSGIH